MICFRLILLLSVLPKFSGGIKVNMQGSLILGKEVMDTLSHFAKENTLNGRRSFGDSDEEDTGSDIIALIVNSAFLCRDITFCHGERGKLVNKYIIALTKAVEGVFKALIDDIYKKSNGKPILIFEKELRILIDEIKRLLRDIDEKIANEHREYAWIDLIKRINFKFQDRAIVFASQRLEGNTEEVSKVKKKLAQKLIVVTSSVELDFESQLCVEHDICSKNQECTKALNTLLEKIKTVGDDRAKEFIRYFYETLSTTSFYDRISDITGQQFQSILHDMAYADDNQTMNIVSVIQKTIEDRLNFIASKFETLDNAEGSDVKLVHILMSDMDHFYDKPKKEPFHRFLGDVYDWAKRGGRFSSELRRVMKDIQNTLTFESDELVLKLVNELRVFLEITVDRNP